MKQIVTRFRAYQLGQAGASFSYCAAGYFTLIEARLTDQSERTLRRELELCGKDSINALHITSWDGDHCSPADLEKILYGFSPRIVEYPGYEPHCDTANDCLKLITNYKASPKKNFERNCVRIDPPYIKSLGIGRALGYNNIMYHPKYISPNSNDNSTVQLFRSGMFNVASLGDIEDVNIAARLRRDRWLSSETDALLLAHHGADCPVNRKRFLEAIRPTLAICASNYDNQHNHPADAVRVTLNGLGIRLFTTKTGDVVLYSLPPHTQRYRVANLKSDSEEVSSSYTFTAKKHAPLSANTDTIRASRQKKSYPR